MQLKEERKEHRAERRYDIERRYGITKEQYNKMVNEQKSICPICKKPLNNDIHVDHDHLSKIVRGLLHGNCNRLLGFANDNIDTFNNAINYLKNNAGIIPKDFTEEHKENQKSGKGRGIKSRK